MCGFCNLFGGRRNSRCYENETRYVSRRCEPRMNVYCASGLGEASDAPCGCDADDRRDNCYRQNHNHCCDCDCD